ncbi:MAG: phosphatase PAP2 family protein [Clostridia bacterium]|nr:phosphatase PAP2 family protein [Clostridia bacterium]
MQKKKRILTAAVAAFAMFVLWTVLAAVVDRAPIAPDGSYVGFATVNSYVHRAVGVNMCLYRLTDLLGIVPIVCVAAFGVFGLCQWLKRKSIRRVDRSLLALGGVYLLVMAVYVFFEFAVINCRPVLIEGVAEASYPSSTTMLALCVMPTAVMELNLRIRSSVARRVLSGAGVLFTAFMVVARLLSGVHWLSDIIGGILFGAGIVLLYYFLIWDL